ncbi:hexokinase-domain-containing protein [Zychaea mexicana]|uniref:hexokinase-domain-containing protein n=1 Tax=Zychaea mexicana TaxID=64656 RepID=UPI0022FF2809|nr:hexokinase-domain-containing protein [Zychaea mexicana]KAI9492949.1 hexokinase-domain-containing protein [Zychaea mexicana]
MTAAAAYNHQVDGTEAQNKAINGLAQEFDVTTERLRTITNQFVEEMRKGLDHEGATVAMIPSYVTGRPTGEEVGRYLALDLGGTNLRVCEFELKGKGDYSVKQQKFVVSDALKTGDMRDLCDYIADSVDTFLTEHCTLPGEGEEKLQLGYTFSFPVLQTEINRGVLKQWTKGFSTKNAVGKDVALTLQEAISRRNLPVNVAAIVNDTVGTLMAYAYSFPDTVMGVILGTGTNASYYEKTANIKKWSPAENDVSAGSDEMVVNMEWGAFDCEREVLPLTMYDNKVNRQSRNIHQQLFEKMISGMYLGEIARNAMLQLIDQYLLFNGESSPALNTQWGFETAYLTAIENDKTADLSETKQILEETVGVASSTTLADRQMVKKIGEFVGRRAARLAASGIGGVMSHCGKVGQESIIAIDGSLFEFYPKFEHHIREGLTELFGQEAANKVRFALARDGSGLGAAIIAMMAHKHGKH